MERIALQIQYASLNIIHAKELLSLKIKVRCHIVNECISQALSDFYFLRHIFVVLFLNSHCLKSLYNFQPKAQFVMKPH